MMSNRKFVIYLLLPIVLINGLVWVFFFNRQEKPVEEKKDLMACDVKGFRRHGFRYTKPLLMLDRTCNDPELEPLRQKVAAFIEEKKQQGSLLNASVYFRLLDNGRNFVVNEDAYSPGSMMKVMTLITYLKVAENNPGILNKQIKFDVTYTNMPVQTIKEKEGLQKGKYYTVNQLLEYMIVDSDNDATALLNSQIDGKIYQEVLSALDLPIPDLHQTDYPLTTESMSRFFRLLYNASFLSPEMSDKALGLLTKTKYDEGITRFLKDDIEVAHKFGEKNIDGTFQLHEGGIFFTGSTDYVLIVMSRGKDQKVLSDVLSNVGKIVFDELVVNYGIMVTHPAAVTKNETKGGDMAGSAKKAVS